MILKKLAVVVFLFNAKVVALMRHVVHCVFMVGQTVVQPFLCRAREQQRHRQPHRTNGAYEAMGNGGFHG